MKKRATEHNRIRVRVIETEGKSDRARDKDKAMRCQQKDETSREKKSEKERTV